MSWGDVDWDGDDWTAGGGDEDAEDYEDFFDIEDAVDELDDGEL